MARLRRNFALPRRDRQDRGRDRAVRAIDERIFSFLSDDDPARVPDGFDPEAWTLRPKPASRLLHDGDEIDLGGRC
jgi:hypothetical protein